MPDWGSGYIDYRRDLPHRVYRGWYGLTAQQKIRESQLRKGRWAEFPDCKDL